MTQLILKKSDCYDKLENEMNDLIRCLIFLFLFLVFYEIQFLGWLIRKKIMKNKEKMENNITKSLT